MITSSGVANHSEPWDLRQLQRQKYSLRTLTVINGQGYGLIPAIDKLLPVGKTGIGTRQVTTQYREFYL